MSIEQDYRDKLRSIVGQALGQASMCWSSPPPFIFDSTQACRVLDDAMNELIRVTDTYYRNLNKDSSG